MISESLLTKTGVIRILLYLEEGETPISELTENVRVSESTIRNRLEELEHEEIVTANAQLIDDSPTRVFALSDDGSQIVNQLSTFVSLDE